jgi:RNase H-fold protein (predicted Holliday junction resolvase)
MTIKRLKIIGINPGTRYLGIAIFQDSELLDWRIKVFKEKWSKEKAKKILEILNEYIDLYALNTIALKKLHPSRRSQNLARLVTRIKEISKRKGIKVYQYSIKDLEEFFIEEDKLNKKNLAEAIVSENPVLFHELLKEKSNKNIYYIRVLEAVALASACAQRLGES